MQRRLIITDADRARLRGERTLADLLPPAQEEKRPTSRTDIVGIAAGLLLTIAVVMLARRVMFVAPPQQEEAPAKPTAQATPTQAAPPPPMYDAYAAPAGIRLGTIPLTVELRYQDSRSPGWAGADWDGGRVWVKADGAGLRDLAPAPTPAVVYVQAPAPPPVECYTVNQTVYDARGYPVGSVEGHSCSSLEEAQANASAQAEQVKAARP